MSGAHLPPFAVTACVFRICNNALHSSTTIIRLLQWNSAINSASLIMRKLAKPVTQRGQSKPPKGLARFIELANMKLDRPLDDASLVFDSAVRDPSKTVKLPDVWEGICAETASTLPPEARAFLGPAADIHGFVTNYMTLGYARKLLPAIARPKWPVAENTSKAVSYPEFKKIQRARSGLPMGVLCQASVDLVVDGRGQLGLSQNPVLEALVGVRADRIRSCNICNRVFWAPRVNSECCSERCRKTYNQRSSRAARRKLLAKKPQLKKAYLKLR
jgi:hypothetical protein